MNIIRPTTDAPASWVRGVNIGGWLILERYIAPYQFALTDCHLKGDFCWYPGQISAPPNHKKLCDPKQCRPYRTPNVFGELDYPIDESSIAAAFANNNNMTAGEEWMNHHFENFITEKDVAALAETGITHVRVPLPHWILGGADAADNNWIVGDRWQYFCRFVKWCRQYGLQVWPDIHTAPGSQNGYDNSGQAKAGIGCKGWSNNTTHVMRSLQVIRDVTAEIVKEGLDDVVTGFGLLNEPFKDCDRDVYDQFIADGRNIVHAVLGPDTAVYVSDMFLAKTFNDGRWWLDYSNTYLDSHYYQVFEDNPRDLSPRQHVAFVCQKQYRDVVSCCYHDSPRNRIASRGVKRLVGEWSAAVDTLPVAMLKTIMDGIAATGTAPHFDRQMSIARQMFLRRFVEAQMVTYEAVETGTGGGWFFWTAKMEGGAFAEWDFLRGVKEGWIPRIPAPNVTSESLYGTCHEIMFKTEDNMDAIDEFPDPADLPENSWKGPDIDDDVVVTHGDSLLHPIEPEHHREAFNWFFLGTTLAFALVAWRVVLKKRRKHQYSQLDSMDSGISA